ncbi:regulator, partial [Rhizobium ruizarguesonis]
LTAGTSRARFHPQGTASFGVLVEAPSKKGFGTRLISSSLSAFGEVALDYAPTGLILRPDAPLQKLQYKDYSDAEE